MGLAIVGGILVLLAVLALVFASGETNAIPAICAGVLGLLFLVAGAIG